MRQHDTTTTQTDEPMFPTGYTVTIDQLLIWLKEFPGDTPVVMSKDAEGNGFSPLSDISAARYLADTAWSGECSDEGDGVAVVCLWPVN
jgi:hypothetical protein